MHSIVYNSLIFPYHNYCVEIWGNNSKSNIQPIFLLQKKAIRLVNHATYYALTNPLFLKLKTLKLHDLVYLNTAVVMYKAHHSQLPHCIQEMFKLRESRYNLRRTGIFKDKVRMKMKSRCISVRGVNLWNNLDEQLKGSNN